MSEAKRQGTSVIILTFLFALLLSVIPLPSWLVFVRPEWVPLVLIYWCLALPTRVNVGVGWSVGLVVDVLEGNLLGQHALAYAVIAFVTVKLHKQIRVYPLWQQALSILVLIALCQLLLAWVRGIIGQAPDSWAYWVSSFISAILWPWVFLLLRDIRRKFRVS
ncbi:MAG: rod shape-determining protein MreD [Gammaproteobacteria bacterium]|nr:rod shape-determining protein MreD [Gammaproteobacteria bacterium]MDH5728335.1 rod shape-determining protein MreD [Gammaproteobacteria bacterium]